MKYSLNKTLIDQKEVLSHVFFNCANDFIQKIVDKAKGKDKAWRDRRKIDIELKIDGNVCDPKNFFDTLYASYSRDVKRKAEALVKEQTSERFNEVANKLHEMEAIVDSWSSEITWEFENPFEKEPNK